MTKNTQDCEHGYNGDCCCNCTLQHVLYCHPLNSDFGKGSIMTPCGFICMAFASFDENKGGAIFFEKEHGMCECHTRRNPADYGRK